MSVIRNDKDKKPSLWRYLALFTEESVYDIGINSGLIPDQDGSFVKDLDVKIKQEIVDTLKIELKTILFDFDHKDAALYNNQEPTSNEFTMIGAGSLGSQVYDNLLKVGFGIWNIVDNDILFPHNLAKHILGRDDVGYNKAERLCDRANHLMGEIISTPVSSNVLDICTEKEFSSKLKNSRAIIDMSTSIAVARVLARDFKNDIKAPRISSFLNPLGNDLVFLAEDKGRKHRLDFLEMQYYRNLNYESKLHSHLQVNQSQRIRYNRSSCRDITNRINQTNVSLLSSIAAKAIQ
nr:ThiF family adenylyltransferase [Nanoarchaeota archaeon]